MREIINEVIKAHNFSEDQFIEQVNNFTYRHLNSVEAHWIRMFFNSFKIESLNISDYATKFKEHISNIIDFLTGLENSMITMCVISIFEKIHEKVADVLPIFRAAL